MKLLPKPLRRRVRHFMAQEVGRLLYGNLPGPANNRAARTRLKNARLACRPEPEVAGALILRRDGCAPYNGIDPARLEVVRQQYLAAIDNPDLTYRIGANAHDQAAPGEPAYRILIKEVAQSVPAAIGLLDEATQRFIVSYYGAHFRLLSAVAWRNFHAPAEVLAESAPYSMRWHVDYQAPDLLKLFVALGPIGDDDGPFHFVTSDRTAELIRMGYRNRYDYRGLDAVLEDPAHVRRLTGPAGTAAFCNTTTNLHRAGIPARGHHRDILQFRLQAARVPFDPVAPLEPSRTIKLAHGNACGSA